MLYDSDQVATNWIYKNELVSSALAIRIESPLGEASRFSRGLRENLILVLQLE